MVIEKLATAYLHRVGQLEDMAEVIGRLPLLSYLIPFLLLFLQVLLALLFFSPSIGTSQKTSFPLV